MNYRPVLLFALLVLLYGCAAQRSAPSADLIISIVGSNDVHGELLPHSDRGGLVGMT